MSKYLYPIIWFTGLQGAGKTTLSKSVYKKLKKDKFKIKLIDGDKFRKKIKNFSYTNKARNQVGDKKLEYGIKFNQKGYIVLISGVAANKQWRKKIKTNNNNLIEVYIKCPLKVLRLRKKIFHSKPFFISKYEEGNTADITIYSNKKKKINAANKVIKFIKKKILNKVS